MSRAVPKHVTEALRAMPLFAGSSSRELQAIARLGTMITVDDGYVFTRQGRRGHEFFVIVDGRASCEIDGHDVARFDSGDFFGEMGLVDHQPRSATVTALSPTTAIVFDTREFHSIFEVAPSAARKLLATMSARLRAAQAV